MPPGPQDWWYEKHKSTCGGTFVKIIEPKKEQEESKVAEPKA
jgi:hypothetical protein